MEIEVIKSHSSQGGIQWTPPLSSPEMTTVVNTIWILVAVFLMLFVQPGLAIPSLIVDMGQ